MLSRPSDLSFGRFAFDPRSRLLRREGVEIPLPPRVVGVLELLLARAGDIVPRQELMETVWKDAFVTDTSLAEAVSYLRQALGDDPQSPTYIQTVHRRGYRFLLPVESPQPVVESPPPPAAPLAVTYDIVAWGIAVVSLIGVVSAIWYATRQQPIAPPVVQMQLAAGDGLVFDHRAPAIALSPAADTIAWSACASQECRLFTRSVGNVQPRALDGTSGAAAPFFSPDGRWLGFFADGKLKKVLVQGGPPIVVADAPHPGGGAWMPDGHIVFASATAGGLLRVSEGGGQPESFTRPAVSSGELRHVFPTATAGGDGLTFLAITSPVDGAPGRLMLRPYRGGPARVLVDNVTSGTLVGREFVTYTRGPNLFAQPYHSGEQEVSGGEQVVASGVLTPHVVISPSGAVAYASAEGIPAEPTHHWRWTASRPAPDLPRLLDAVLSPAGTRVAGFAPGSNAELWTADLARGTTSRVTYATPAAAPAWGTDGASVFYASKRPGRYEIWARDASSNGDERKVLAVDDRHVFPSSSARQRLAYVETGGDGGANVGVLDLSSGDARLVAKTRFDEIAPVLSPDSERVAYQTDESGQWEVVLLDLASGRRSPISTAGGTRPLWSSDGGSLFFENRSAVWRVAITAQGQPEGASTLVHSLQSERLVGVAGDGSLLLERDPEPRAAHAIVTLEWIRELRRTVGPPPLVPPR